MHAVELAGFTKAYKSPGDREVWAVRRLDLQIAEGEFFSLLGPSGCGKTTTLRAIAGFEMPTSGDIYIHGQPMRDRPPFHRPVNTVFQNYALFPHLTVAQNVAFGLEMEGLSRSDIGRRVEEALELVQLAGMETRRPRQLSGGQQQRVALARALVKRPEVLLLDEPLGALDLKLRKQMQLELKQVQQQVGITFIYVTHDQEEALTMSDRIGVMDGGELLQVGTPMEIYEEPNCRFVADFIGETNFLSGKVVEKGVDTAVVVVDEQLSIVARCSTPLQIGQPVTLVIRPEKVTLFSAAYSDAPCLPGTVAETVYIGTDTRFGVRLTPHSSLVVRSQNQYQGTFHTFTSGEAVQVRIPPESIRVLPADITAPLPTIKQSRTPADSRVR